MRPVPWGALALTALALAALGGTGLPRPWAAPALQPLTQGLLGAWTLLGWIANVAICGALSTPHERYNMRVIWLLPIAASVIVARAVIIQRRAPIARNLVIGS